MKIKWFQKIIDKIRGKSFGLDNMLKKAITIKNRHNITTLALGSSHMEQGFIPQTGEFNLGSPSQDLYYSYLLYKRFNTTSLKNIFITFSVFSPNNMLMKSGDAARLCILFKLLFGIEYQDEQLAKQLDLYELESSYVSLIRQRKFFLKIPKDYYGQFLYNKHKNITIDVDATHKRALAHYKINQKNSNQMNFCLKLLEDTEKNKQNLYFVLPPVHHIYKEVLPCSDILFACLYKACTKFSHVHILNLYDSEEFIDEDFEDADHLNKSGAYKMTEIIHKEIYNIKEFIS